jgi:hypothetical protein
MKKDTRIIERIAIDSELEEETKKRLRTTKLRLREIYNLLPEMTVWEEYQKFFMLWKRWIFWIFIFKKW